jgi:hypothetical protein
MKKNRNNTLLGWLGLALGVALCVGFVPGAVMGAEGIDPEADQILRSMSACLGGTTAFSVNADIDNEVVTRKGQKLQLSSFATVVMERPAKFHVQRRGAIANAELIFDGKTLTLHGKNLNVYAQVDVPGTIDDAIRAVEFETGLDAPGADLLFSDPYAILSSEVVSSAYLGAAYINGVECHHLAYRKDKVDWQLWVRTGNVPLPMKYVITSKWITGAPQYEVRLRDWNTKPRIKAGQFTFAAPKGATRLETIPVNEMGELTIEEGTR